MNRKQFIQHLVSQFEGKIRALPDEKLAELESGKLEINLTYPVGQEAGGTRRSHRAARASGAG